MALDTTRLSLDRPHSEPFDEAVDKKIVNNCERNADEQGRRHERPPVIHVPRTRAIGTPRLTVIFWTELMKVRAYTNSCRTNVNVKTTTVRMPGTISLGATRRMTARRLYPSIIACSSISQGTERRNPMTSQVQNGIVIVG